MFKEVLRCLDGGADLKKHVSLEQRRKVFSELGRAGGSGGINRIRTVVATASDLFSLESRLIGRYVSKKCCPCRYVLY